MVYRCLHLTHLDPQATIGEDLMDAYGHAIREWNQSPNSRTDQCAYDIAPITGPFSAV